MRLVRTMMAIVIALSVAMLPVVGSAASIVSSASQPAAEAVAKDMSMTSDISGAMDGCCSDHAKAKPCDQRSDQCPMAFCAGQPVNLATTGVFRLDFPIVAGSPLPIPVDQVVSLNSGSPPFRPPRV